MEIPSSFNICKRPCGKCSISLHDEFNISNTSNVILNRTLLYKINSIEFVVILYQLYKIKQAHNCYINFQDSLVSCDKVILINLNSTNSGPFGKTFALELIEQWNQVRPSDMIYITHTHQNVFNEPSMHRDNIEFLAAFKYVIQYSLSISENVFDYICSQWQCKIKSKSI